MGSSPFSLARPETKTSVSDPVDRPSGTALVIPADLISGVSAADGPASANTAAPASRRADTASWNRTVPRIWVTQWSAYPVTSVGSNRPVTVETTGIRGGRYPMEPATSRNSSSTSSMCGEWKAWLTLSRVIRRPRSRQPAATLPVASSSPAITTDTGPFTAATTTPSTRVPAISASVASTAIIAPPDRARCISRPRAATSRAASGSENTPAT